MPAGKRKRIDLIRFAREYVEDIKMPTSEEVWAHAHSLTPERTLFPERKTVPGAEALTQNQRGTKRRLARPRQQTAQNQRVTRRRPTRQQNGQNQDNVEEAEQESRDEMRRHQSSDNEPPVVNTPPRQAPGARRQQQRTSHSPPTKPHEIGFPNLGNTCYMGVVLQALLALEPFCELLDEQEWRVDEQSVPRSSLIAARPASLLFLLEQLGAARKQGNKKRIKEALTDFHDAMVQKLQPRFEKGLQHDAVEWFEALLEEGRLTRKDRLHDRVLDIFQFTRKERVDCITEWCRFFYEDTNQSVLGETSGTVLRLHRDVPDLQEALTWPDNANPNPRHRCCPDCFEVAPFLERTHILIKVPQVLLLQLARFTQGQVRSMEEVKCYKPIDLETSDKQIVHYVPRAVVFIHGETVQAGHYTAHVLQKDGDRERWFEYSDLKVTRTRVEADMTSKDAYLVIYEKQ